MTSAKTLEVHAFHLDQPMPDGIYSSIRLLQHQEADERLVPAVYRSHFNEHQLRVNRTKPVELNPNRSADLSFDRSLCRGFQLYGCNSLERTQSFSPGIWQYQVRSARIHQSINTQASSWLSEIFNLDGRDDSAHQGIVCR